MVQLALTLARRVVHREVTLDPELAAALAHVALERLGTTTPATIRLNPEDYTVVAQDGARWGGQTVTVVPDPSISRGGCLVESAFGSVDATIERAVRRAEPGPVRRRPLIALDRGGPCVALELSRRRRSRRSRFRSSATSCARSACWSNRAGRGPRSASCASCSRRADAASRSKSSASATGSSRPCRSAPPPASGRGTRSSRAAAAPAIAGRAGAARPRPRRARPAARRPRAGARLDDRAALSAADEPAGARSDRHADGHRRPRHRQPPDRAAAASASACSAAAASARARCSA